MYRYSVQIVIAALVLAGCAKQPSILPKRPPSINPIEQPKKISVDAYLLQAAMLESQGFMYGAAKNYQKAYERTKNREILYKYIQTLYKAKQYDEAFAAVQKALKQYPDDQTLYELLASIEYERGNTSQAIQAIKKAIALGQEPQDMEFLASLFLKQKNYKEALRYFTKAYRLAPKSSTAASIAYIKYFYLDKKDEAIAFLETHVRMYGCDALACRSLATFYGLRNDIEGLISIYKRLYASFGKKEYARKLAEYYIYQKEYKKALRWAKIVGDEKLLLDLYRATKEYDKAFELAQKLFAKTHDYNYLALSAMFEYEKAKKKDPKLLQDVMARFNRALKHVQDPVYLNYLGYLLIEHDLDIPRGIELVKKALQKEPNSGYYLDSLAWGFYKLGRCKEALPLIKRVYFDMNLKDPEVELHLKKIQECVKKEAK